LVSDLTSHSGVHKKGTMSIQDILQLVRNKIDFTKVGAITIFIGVVRGETIKGDKVKGLELQAYEKEANGVLENICSELKTREGIVDVQIHHFTGEFELGEDLVYVLVAGGNRHHAFPVLKEAVERYKKEAPIFKKEHLVCKRGGTKSYWVSERKNM
jgi:molybdopterin synthase catalytic subunit